MGKLSEMPNIGKTLEQRLAAVGLMSYEALIDTGSQEAFLKILIYEGDTCINVLYALEGAIQGIRWHDLSRERKDELKRFYDVSVKGRKY